MELADIFSVIRDEIDADDQIREKVLPLSRNAVRKCSESIKMTHKKEFAKAKVLVEEAHDIIASAMSEMPDSTFVSKSKTMDIAYQELTEAANVLSLIEYGKYTPPEKYQIPSRPYLNGLADVIGELRRSSLDSLRHDDVNKAEHLLSLMEEVLEGLQLLDYPNALVPDLRRKCDVGRALVEKTRGDLTRAVGQSKLVKELADFEKRISKSE
ncbi:MAG: translin family protein [Candidatus Thorarchaeota archaeon]|nr:MAG: translin family protein [Candidatus Thorarchaeota archaeon]